MRAIDYRITRPSRLSDLLVLLVVAGAIACTRSPRDEPFATPARNETSAQPAAPAEDPEPSDRAEVVQPSRLLPAPSTTMQPRGRLPIDPADYPPRFVQTSDSEHPLVPTAPPPESEAVHSIEAADLPPDVQAQLQRRLEEKIEGERK